MGPFAGLSHDEPYIVGYQVLLNHKDFPSGFSLGAVESGIDSGASRIFSLPSCYWGAWELRASGVPPVHRPEDVIHLVAVMEHDRSDLDTFFRLMIWHMRGAVIALREAGVDRTTMVSRLIGEFDRLLRESAVLTAGGLDPDDLIARPQEVSLSPKDFWNAGRGAHVNKRVHHVGADGHHVTLHRLRPG